MNEQERTAEQLQNEAQAYARANYIQNQKRALFGPYPAHYRTLVREERRSHPAAHTPEEEQRNHQELARCLTAKELSEAWDHRKHPEFYENQNPMGLALGQELQRRYNEQQKFSQLSVDEQKQLLRDQQDRLNDYEVDRQPMEEVRYQQDKARMETLRTEYERELQNSPDRQNERDAVRQTEQARQEQADEQKQQDEEEARADPDRQRWQDYQNDLAGRVFAVAGLRGVEDGTRYLARAATIQELSPEERDRKARANRLLLDHADPEEQPELTRRLQEEALLYEFADAVDRSKPEILHRWEQNPAGTDRPKSLPELPKDDQVEVVQVAGHSLALLDHLRDWNQKHFGSEARQDRRDQLYNRMYRKLDDVLEHRNEREEAGRQRGEGYLAMLQPPPEACLTLRDLMPEELEEQERTAAARANRETARKLQTGWLTAEDFAGQVKDLPLSTLEQYGDTLDKQKAGERITRNDPGYQFVRDPVKRDAIRNELQSRNAKITRLAEVNSPEDLDRRCLDLQDHINSLERENDPRNVPRIKCLNQRQELMQRASAQATIQRMTPEEVVSTYANGFAQISVLTQKGDLVSRKQAENLSRKMVPYRAELVRIGKDPAREVDRYFAQRQSSRPQTEREAPRGRTGQAGPKR